MAATNISGLMPPGPPLPRWMQTLGFIVAPVPFIEGARRRYGDVVTFRSLFDPGFVMVFDSLLVKEVLRGSPDQLRAGRPTPLSARWWGNARCSCWTGPSTCASASC